MAKISNSASSECAMTDQEAVDTYLQKLNHPMKEVAELLRKIILGTHKDVGEEIAWNAPTFYYNGKMKPFSPKEYKRFIVGFNFFKKDCLRLIFYRGALIKDPSGLLSGDFPDDRKLALFKSIAEVNARKKELQGIITELVKLIRKS
jgi:hypothetical protein